MGLLDGRNAIVTGSARGLGLAMAERFGAEGARVVLSDVDAAALEEAQHKLSADGLEVSAIPADVTDSDAVAALVRHCADSWGSVDVMVNNAGITRDGVLRKMSSGRPSISSRLVREICVAKKSATSQTSTPSTSQALMTFSICSKYVWRAFKITP